MKEPHNETPDRQAMGDNQHSISSLPFHLAHQAFKKGAGAIVAISGAFASIVAIIKPAVSAS